MLCPVPEAFLHDNVAAKLSIFCRGVWTRCLASSRQRDDKPTDSPANQRNGMTAAPVGTWGEPRRQAVKRIAGVSVKFGLRSESGQFWECSALERNAMQRKISGATKSWTVSRIILTACTGRSLAVHIALPSATGNSSRRIATSCPCEASRANNFLAGRSLAAILLLSHARARSARTGTQ